MTSSNSGLPQEIFSNKVSKRDIQMYQLGGFIMNRSKLKISRSHDSNENRRPETKAESINRECFIVDRPFAFFLWNVETWTCLMSGKIVTM